MCEPNFKIYDKTFLNFLVSGRNVQRANGFSTNFAKHPVRSSCNNNLNSEEQQKGVSDHIWGVDKKLN